MQEKQEEIEEIDLGDIDNIRLKRIYDYKPYSFWRIKEILRESYNAYLEEIVWYKCNRVKNYHQKYRIKDITTHEILVESVFLDDLRRVFANHDFPLKETNKRNKGAEYFLQTVNNSVLSKEQVNE